LRNFRVSAFLNFSFYQRGWGKYGGRVWEILNFEGLILDGKSKRGDGWRSSMRSCGEEEVISGQ
jgi:hypothetical protein